MSLDAEIAALARAVRESPEDAMARYRWRCALVRAGRGSEAGFEVGDVVWTELYAKRFKPSGQFVTGRVDKLRAVAALHRVVVQGPWPRRLWRADNELTLLEPARPQSVPA